MHASATAETGWLVEWLLRYEYHLWQTLGPSVHCDCTVMHYQ